MARICDDSKTIRVTALAGASHDSLAYMISRGRCLRYNVKKGEGWWHLRWKLPTVDAMQQADAGRHAQ